MWQSCCAQGMSVTAGKQTTTAYFSAPFYSCSTSPSNSYDNYVVPFSTRKSKFRGNKKRSDRFAEPFLRAARSYQYLSCKTKFVN